MITGRFYLAYHDNFSTILHMNIYVSEELSFSSSPSIPLIFCNRMNALKTKMGKIKQQKQTKLKNMSCLNHLVPIIIQFQQVGVAYLLSVT